MRKTGLWGVLLVYCYTLLFYFLIYFTPLRNWAEPLLTPYLLLPFSALTVGGALLCARRVRLRENGIFSVRLPGFYMELSQRLVHRGLIILLLLDVAYCFFPLDFVTLGLSRLVTFPLEATGDMLGLLSSRSFWLFFDQNTLHQPLLFLTAFFFLRTRDMPGREAVQQLNI